MKLRLLSNGILLVLFSLSFSSCTTTRTTNNMTSIGIQDTLKVKVGELFNYAYHTHSSVGIEGDYGIEDTEIVAYHDKDFEYENPKAVAKGLNGADSATGVFVFKALKAGTTIIEFREIYRGDVRETRTVTIVVTE